MGSYDRAVYANIARANDGAEPMYSEEALELFAPVAIRWTLPILTGVN